MAAAVRTLGGDGGSHISCPARGGRRANTTTALRVARTGGLSGRRPADLGDRRVPIGAWRSRCSGREALARRRMTSGIVSRTGITDAAKPLGLAGKPVCIDASLRSFPKVESGAETLIEGQAGLAGQMGVSQPYIAAVKAGRQNLKLSQIAAIASALGIDVEIVFTIPD